MPLDMNDVLRRWKAEHAAKATPKTGYERQVADSLAAHEASPTRVMRKDSDIVPSDAEQAAAVGHLLPAVHAAMGHVPSDSPDVYGAGMSQVDYSRWQCEIAGRRAHESSASRVGAVAEDARAKNVREGLEAHRHSPTRISAKP